MIIEIQFDNTNSISQSDKFLQCVIALENITSEACLFKFGLIT